MLFVFTAYILTPTLVIAMIKMYTVASEQYKPPVLGLPIEAIVEPLAGFKSWI